MTLRHELSTTRETNKEFLNQYYNFLKQFFADSMFGSVKKTAEKYLYDSRFGLFMNIIKCLQFNYDIS